MSIKKVETINAPKAIGPYSQGIIANGMLYTSGQIALDPETGVLVSGGIESQTHRVFNNLISILEEAGSSLDKVIKVSIFVKNLTDFETINSIYKDYFKEHKPARSTVEVSRLPMDVLIEMDMVALV